MKLLIALFCLSAASAMTNERKPTIAIESNASSSFGDVLLQAKASTFLEMASSTDDHYALLESLNIDPGVSACARVPPFLFCFSSYTCSSSFSLFSTSVHDLSFPFFRQPT